MIMLWEEFGPVRCTGDHGPYWRILGRVLSFLPKRGRLGVDINIAIQPKARSGASQLYCDRAEDPILAPRSSSTQKLLLPIGLGGF